MYNPAAFRNDDPAAIDALLAAHPFAEVVTVTAGRAEVSHLPLLASRESDGTMMLRGHFARANPESAAVAAGAEALVVFRGPHTYISPRWYTRPEASVPTWNYQVVHVRGRLQPVDDPAEVRRMLADLSAAFEPPPPAGWTPERIGELTDKLLPAITAFVLRAESVEAKFKLGQNRTAADVESAVAGLRREPARESPSDSARVADAMAAAHAARLAVVRPGVAAPGGR